MDEQRSRESRMEKFWEFICENKWLFLILLLGILIPIGINLFFLFGDIKTGVGLENDKWLAFWGSYIGGIATLIAVCLTLRQNTKVIQQNEKVISQNEKNQRQQERHIRINHMPYMDVGYLFERNNEFRKLPKGFIVLSEDHGIQKLSYVLPKKYRDIIDKNIVSQKLPDGTFVSGTPGWSYVRLLLTQKGAYLARDIQLSFRYKGSRTYLTHKFALSAGEKVRLIIIFDPSFPKEEYEFIFSLEDILGNYYEQEFTIKLKGSLGYSITTISKPRLIVTDQND